MPSILIDCPKPGVKRLTLNKPERLNAFSFGMYGEFLTILRDIKYDVEVRVVVLTGAGRGFCSGQFIGEGDDPLWVARGLGRAQQGKYIIEEMGQLSIAMRGLTQPIIAAVNGAAAGIGYALALAADIAIAGQSAKFVNSCHNAGTGAEIGLSYFLPRAVGSQRAAEILYTSRAIPADEAERIGLVLRTVPDEHLMDEVLLLADAIMANSPFDISLTKQTFQHNQDAASLTAAIELESRASVLSNGTEDAAEKQSAFWDKRAPQFRNR